MLKFFDKFEDLVRSFLSHFPLWYALVGGIGVVLFWRGVWHSMDYLVYALGFYLSGSNILAGGMVVWWDGPLSLALGCTVLLATGLFVANFIGSEIIISGLKGEKKLSEKSEKELETESQILSHMEYELEEISTELKSSRK